jgi:DNA topoisomerase-1
VLAAVELAREEEPRSKAAAERSIRAAVERVAELLGNTPAVCRRSYIDPRVIERFRDGVVIQGRGSVEREVLRLLA